MPKSVANKELLKLDRDLFKYGKSFEILDRLKWKAAVRDKFLKSWRKGNKVLPKISYQKLSYQEDKNFLKHTMKSVDRKNPMGEMIYLTARSYHRAARMLESLGTKQFSELSTKLYGSPDDRIAKLDLTTERAAMFFLSASKKFSHVMAASEADYCLRPEYVVAQIKKTAKKVFKDQDIVVKTSSQLVSKASAGVNRVRVRSGTCFAPHDIDQLVNHELLVHTLTLINGRHQKLKILGLNSPRTTRTQEGLAIFSEFITSTIDMHRLRRISARVHATQMGLNGANFIEVFEFFLNQGQNEQESYYSTMRVFRGGKVTGNVVFTKDIVYLRGFIEVHDFFLKALSQDKFLHPNYLFAGRLSTKDIPNLEPYFQSEFLTSPKYQPDWIKNRSTLLAFLLSSSLMNKLGLANR